MGHADTAERLFLQASPGLEGVLEVEARALGRARRVAGGVELEGPPGTHAEANLRLRIAERVLHRLHEARAGDWKEARQLLRAAALDRVTAPGGALALESTVRLPGAPRTAAGVAEALSRLWKRPVSPVQGTERDVGPVRLVLRATDGILQLSADSSGTLLHRRGWRQEVSRAPMRETLAAGVLRLARHDGTVPFWDPLCGSGTLVIEAALAARRIAPGLGRRFAAEDWPIARAVDWEWRRRRLEGEALERAPAVIVGADLNAGSLGTARRNARRAGVLADLRLDRRDVAVADPGAGAPGLLVANLPYGIRVGERGALAGLDAALARTLSGPFSAWRVALLVDDTKRLERMGRGPPETVHRLSNGGMPVVLAVWCPSG